SLNNTFNKKIVSNKRSHKWTSLAIVCLSSIIICSLFIITILPISIIRGVREYRRLVTLNDSISSSRSLSI
ncbi:hypothetical protein PFISCL1PPCAC_14961, partial [Pristionchus fissidentatus]